jgi:hypothetical protein
MGNPISKDTFLSRAKARFGETYDYSSILYKSYKTPVKIRCTKHPVKEISITPERHLQTTGGCKYCLREKRIRLLERELSMPDTQPPAPLPPAEPAAEPSVEAALEAVLEAAAEPVLPPLARH